MISNFYLFSTRETLVTELALVFDICFKNKKNQSLDIEILFLVETFLRFTGKQ